MKVPILKKSLCGCNLRTGSLCVAYIYLLSCVLLASVYTYVLCTTVGLYFHITYVADGITVVLQVAATIFLLVGLYKKNRNHISHWIWISIVIGIALLLECLDLSYDIIFNFDGITLSISIVLGIIIVLKVYAVLIVYNYLKELSEDYENNAEYMADEVQLV